MPRMKDQKNGRLEEAMTLLINNQAHFLARASEIDQRIAEMDRINSERFARIETILHEHSRILAEHGRLLEETGRILQDLPDMLKDLPDAVQRKFGFHVPEPPPSGE